jgi:hypothetical protein
MFRNPIDMVYSFHSQLLYVAEEDEPDFEKAWRLQERRNRGLDLPPRSRGAFLLQYADLGRFGTQTERLLATFPREQVKLILFDDFAASPQAVYDQVIEFLEIPHDGRTEFPRINDNKRARVDWLRRFARKPPPMLRNAIRGLKQAVGGEGIGEEADRGDEHGEGAPPAANTRVPGRVGGDIPGGGRSAGSVARPRPEPLGVNLPPGQLQPVLEVPLDEVAGLADLVAERRGELRLELG